MTKKETLPSKCSEISWDLCSFLSHPVPGTVQEDWEEATYLTTNFYLRVERKEQNLLAEFWLIQGQPGALVYLLLVREH